ncbi:DEAD/DEAH box helicase [Stieleria sp. ICT_E10.1]|uniref:DEAD/DEAH box helicase n=1 Tax=Stieleria sedimenti TaxID=2976331 RepID=UPI00217FF582|nr:DEAD/DEAH box helicase [Stieleria sedimenti]MCS7465585.1 DEAD/DEAH box helicase [Stieleria sedimenti]
MGSENELNLSIEDHQVTVENEPELIEEATMVAADAAEDDHSRRALVQPAAESPHEPSEEPATETGAESNADAETDQPSVEPAVDAVAAEMKEAVGESVAPDETDERADHREEEEEEEQEAPTGFAALELRRQVFEAVVESGYSEPTSVQQQVIPHMLAGRDVLAQSQTGSGKTAAFALPILSTIDSKQRTVQTLVLAPTRELAIQVAESFEKYAENLKGFSVLAIYGGQDYEHQFRALRRGVDVVVGTPGRVIDHIKRGTLDLSELRCLVLDEADEMLNMGFLEDVEFVLDQTPEKRQVTLFSATMPGPIRSIADKYLVDPALVTIEKKQVTAESIRQRAVIVPPKEKVNALTRFLEAEATDGVIVFTKTKDTTVRLAEQLIRNGFAATALNGDMPQSVRERTIEQLKDGRLNVLVATDVAARGLDVTRLSHVFNFDLPHDAESYIHRIGRTGRAGRSGEAIIFLTPAQRRKLKLIERATKKSIELVDVPSADAINATRIERFKASITQVIADKDLTLFKDLIGQYAEESGKSMEAIAAALAEIAQHGRPFLLKDRPKRARDEYQDRGESRRGGDERSGGGEFGKRGRVLGPPEPGMMRYRIEVGRNDGVAPRNIVGAVANEAGIESQMIGPIKIYPHFSTIDLPEGMPKDVYQTLQRAWVSGKQLRIRPDRGPAQGDSPSRSGGFRKGGKPGGKNRSKPDGFVGGKSGSFGGKSAAGKKKKKKKHRQD